MADRLSEEEIEVAWRQAKTPAGLDARLFRITPDVLQSLIRRDRFDVCGEYGWQIEHGKPVSYHAPSLESAMRLIQCATYDAAHARVPGARNRKA